MAASVVRKEPQEKRVQLETYPERSFRRRVLQQEQLKAVHVRAVCAYVEVVMH